MKLVLRVLFFFLGVIASSDLANAQLAPLKEEDMSFEVLKWHYAKYPKSEETVWELVTLTETKQYLRATFKFEDRETIAVYDLKGKIISERVDMIRDVPVSLDNYIMESYEKPKITSFYKKTNFLADEVVYRMELRSKNNGEETLEFDKDLIPFDKNLLTGSN